MKNLPEKIYATPNFDRRWQTKAIDEESVEYVRKDAFIEKAYEYLSYHLDTSKIDVDYKFEVIEELRKAMKDE